MSRGERTRALRYKKGALASMGFRAMLDELGEIVERCDDVSYFIGDMDTLIDALDGNDEDAFEFRMAFCDLSARAEALYERVWEMDGEQYDDCTVALIGNWYEMVGYDGYEEDYFSLTDYEAELSTTEAGKRLMRHTKAEMISMIGQALGTLLAFVNLRQQYDYLKATMDVLTDDNHSVLQQIKQIEALYEKVCMPYPARSDVEMFDRVTAFLPERMWVE